MVEFEYEDEVLKLISKSSSKTYHNRYAEIPSIMGFMEKEWYLEGKRKNLERRKVIDLDE